MKYIIDKKIRLIELFGGIGAQAKALEILDADFEHYRLCEIDKNAVMSYNAIHNTNFIPQDIKQWHGNDLGVIDTDKFEYILTWSWPCQSNSCAGKGGGFKKGSGTASSIVWEVERLLSECETKPQVLLMENVCQCRTGKNKEDFDLVCKSLENMGYTHYLFDLNAKDYNIPQSRKRCFMVSLYNTDKEFVIPETIPLKHKVRDYFEPDVDESFYIAKEKAEPLIKDLVERGEIKTTDVLDDTMGFDGKPRLYSEYSPTIRASRYGLKAIEQIVAMRGRYKGTNNSIKQQLEPNKESTSNCITTVQKDNLCLENYIVYDDYNSNVRKDQDTIGTITTNIGNRALRNGTKIIVGYALRNLTPKEVMRIMGFDDADYEKMATVSTKTKIYRQAGNSIAVNCLTAIFGQFFEGKENLYKTHTPDFLTYEVKPFIKWAGGKTQLLPELTKNLPSVTKYAEPFVGGGAFLCYMINHFSLNEIYISDANERLINVYKTIIETPDELVENLIWLEKSYNDADDEGKEQLYYAIRTEYNIFSGGACDAAKFIFLNKTCFNGLYRVNKKGEFNVPWGKKKSVYFDYRNIYVLSDKLTGAVLGSDYKQSFAFADEHTLTYFDPPYRPIVKQSFTSYTENGFDDDKQIELAEFAKNLKGKVMLSNSDPKNTNPDDNFFDDLYKDFNIRRVMARRNINSKGDGREPVTELIIDNFTR